MNVITLPTVTGSLDVCIRDTVKISATWHSLKLTFDSHKIMTFTHIGFNDVISVDFIHILKIGWEKVNFGFVRRMKRDFCMA